MLDSYETPSKESRNHVDVAIRKRATRHMENASSLSVNLPGNGTAGKSGRSNNNIVGRMSENGRGPAYNTNMMKNTNSAAEVDRPEEERAVFKEDDNGNDHGQQSEGVQAPKLIAGEMDVEFGAEHEIYSNSDLHIPPKKWGSDRNLHLEEDDSGGSKSHSDEHLQIPLEISSREAYNASRASSFGSTRLNKFVLACSIIAIIFVATAALMARKALVSSETEESKDGNDIQQSHGQHTESTIGDEETATEAANEALGEDEPNPPKFPSSMQIFFPPQNENEAKELSATLQSYSDPMTSWSNYYDDKPKPEGYPDSTYLLTHQFTSRRTALLFAPGTYPIDFEVGYYTSVLGLGALPTDVTFANTDRGPHVPAMDKFDNRPPHGTGLENFWRSVENVAVNASLGMQWVVSQAAPLRRMHIHTNLDLYEGDSWVSGGVAANVVVDGQVNFGGQQQWLMRNVLLKGGAVNGAWSLVFVGCSGDVPKSSDGMEGGPSVSVEDSPSVRVEKPYVTMKMVGRSTGDQMKDKDRDRQYQLELRVPAPTFDNEAYGPQFEDEREDVRDFRRVFLAVPSDSVNEEEDAVLNHDNIQKALDEGKDVVLSPGIYPLSKSLKVKYNNQVVLGLGYATLVAPHDGTPCIQIHSRVKGVRVAGIMLEASSPGPNGQITTSLLEWGSPNNDDPGDERNPGVLSDVYVRVGGAVRDVSAHAMIRLHSGCIYGDNLWLWRADHVQLGKQEEANFPEISRKYRQTQRGECEVRNGLIVDAGAPNVIIVGLAVEHTTEDQVLWDGDNGQVYFYQCEFPYDVDHSFAENGYAGYRLGPKVKDHKAMGLGIYSNFRDYDVKVDTAVKYPLENNDGIRMTNIFTVKLDNQGKISSIVNGRGPGPTIDSERGHPHRCSDEKCPFK